MPGILTRVISARTVEFAPYTVSTLPTATAGVRAFVNDSTVAASGNFGVVVSGGGANVVPVYYDGSNWRIG